MTTGESIRSARVHRAWSQQRLADRLGIAVTYLSRLENDHSDPSVALLKRIAHVCRWTLTIRLEPT